MSDEAATNPGADGEVLSGTGVADQTQVSDDTLNLEPQLDENGNPVEPELTEEDLEEIEHDGKKFKLPKALKPALMMQADYTRKTQELAERSRALDADRAQQVQADEGHKKLLGITAAIDIQLEQFGKVDWQTWSATDPAAAQAAFMRYQGLKDAKADADKAISQHEQTATEAQRAQHATRLQEGQAVLAKEIPGWGKPEVTAELVATGKKYGFTDQELGSITDPRMIKALWDARSNAKTATQAQQVARTAAGQKTTPVQATRGGGGQFTANPATNDFKAFETMADTKLKKRS